MEDSSLTIYLFAVLVVDALLALIPANLAKNKGHSFGLWWFYGFMLFIVAVIHVNFIPDKNAPQTPANATVPTPYYPPANTSRDAADELKKYKELMDQGVITEAEFQAKKEQLLKLL